MKIPKAIKRGDAWRIQVSINGKRLSATFDTKEECERWASIKILEGKAGRKIETKNIAPSFKEIFILYYEKVGKFKPSARIIREQLRAFDWKFGVLAHKQINEITAKELTDWRNKRMHSVSASTLLREISLFSAVFSWVQKDLFLIHDNAWQQIQKPKSPKPRQRRITCAEIEKILKALNYQEEEPKNTKHWVGFVFLLALETAMRRGEILNLKSEDVEERFIFVKQSKNGEPRKVPLSKKARDLVALVPRCEAQNAFIKCSSNAFRIAWGKALKKANLTDIHFHDTRHEAISRMVRDLGIPVEKLAKITGHKDIKTLINVYYNPSVEELASFFD